MPKKKYDFEDGELTQEAEPAPVEKAEANSEYYTRVLWKDVSAVFKCVKCKQDFSYEDEAIEHALTHYPLEMQEDLLEQLLKEKNNG